MIRTGIVVCALLGSLAAQAVTLDQIQKVLAKSRAGWTAADTGLADLSLAEKKKMLGLRDEVTENPFSYEIIDQDGDDLPPAWDWRQVDGKNFDTAIRAQGRCGSCVAFASIAAIEMQLNIAGRNPGFDFDLSEQHMFHCGGASCKTGWFATSGLNFAKANGVPDEQCFAYKSGNVGADQACTNTCADAKQRSTFAAGFRSISGGVEDIVKIKTALLQGPLLTTMIVYEDFYAYSGGVYEYKVGPRVGGHAITMLGYSNEKKAWLVKNSWGDEWGEKGYFWIKWGDISGLGKSTFQVDIPPMTEYVKIVAPADYDVLSGTAAIEAENTVVDATSLTYALKGSSGSFLLNVDPSNRSNTFTFNTTAFPDGVYDLSLQAQKGDKLITSAHKSVTILNSTPQAGLSLIDPKSGSTISGKILLTYECSAQKIPFTHLATVIEGMGIKKEYEVVNPCPKMIVRMRTYDLPNGEYTVRGTGRIGAAVKTDSNPITLTVANPPKP